MNYPFLFSIEQWAGRGLQFVWETRTGTQILTPISLLQVPMFGRDRPDKRWQIALLRHYTWSPTEYVEYLKANPEHDKKLVDFIQGLQEISYASRS